jgi:sulfite reductase beta subunit-like hemoprotein
MRVIARSCSSFTPSARYRSERTEERLRQMNITDPLTSPIHIKVSGCPNGCGQHHLGIGLYSGSIKVGAQTIPAYPARPSWLFMSST